ncbi:MAG: M20/M25/M40 family metallo-hydrolase [Defluviitaleaceae bacterium]|nr:M20/M25/M40 family metallo-hydrolase [Defluviitaleaceae bacterium]
MINEKRLLEEFIELIQIDSVTKHERKIADALIAKLHRLGLENVREDDSAKASGCEAGNILAFLKGNVLGADTIFLNAHMDTVEPGNGIKPIIGEDGIITSDGSTILAADDKSGIAAIFETIRVLKENNLPHGDIEILFTAGEESGLLGAKGLKLDALKAKYGYALDSGGQVGGLKIQSPARQTMHVKIYGTPVHAGNVPEKGVSAIAIGAKAITTMPHGRVDFETTSNVGVFQAASPLNIVTEYAEVKIEARSLVQAKLDAQMQAMRQAFETAANEFGGRVEVEIFEDCSAYKLEESDTVVQVAIAAAAKIGRECKLFAAGGASDANIFNGLGIKTGILACGFEGAHAKTESIQFGEICKLTEMTLAVISEVVERSKNG